MDPKRTTITGRAISVRGNDIDTDRIIPARFLKCVVFDGLGAHAFEDDRLQLAERGKKHPFDDEKFQGAQVLLVNKNFGCGSSREHAPQAIMRWGIRAIIGESFAEIFFGNCVALGIPCVTVDEQTIEQLMKLNEENPAREFTVDLINKTAIVDGKSIPVQIPDGPRQQFLEGRWDSTFELLDGKEVIAAASAKLPYFANWK